MYGDPDVIRRRAAQLREQGVDLRGLADLLVARTESLAWTGRAADALRERIRERAAQVRVAAARHDTAAASLERHLQEVDHLKETIADIERRAASLEAAGRPAPATPPPSGHKDWLHLSVPGL